MNKSKSWIESLYESTFDLWPKYLEYIDEENHKIKARNKVKSDADSKKFAESLDLYKKIQQAIDDDYQKRLKDLKDRQHRWDEQTWVKKLTGPDRPNEPIAALRYAPFEAFFAHTEPEEVEKIPTVEDFLTWQVARTQHSKETD